VFDQYSLVSFARSLAGQLGCIFSSYACHASYLEQDARAYDQLEQAMLMHLNDDNIYFWAKKALVRAHIIIDTSSSSGNSSNTRRGSAGLATSDGS
jgi:hypothetical protein